MFARTGRLCRQQTSWRALLHPLPIGHRRMQWLKRDQVELNEAALRRPYYTIKQHATKERDEALRESSLALPNMAGPHLPGLGFSTDSRLKPRYPESWDTVVPHQVSRAD